MGKVDHWVRNENGERVFTEIPDIVETDNLKERIDKIVVEVPYFNQAAQLILFLKENTNTYPNTKRALGRVDDRLIASAAYLGLTEGEKAQLLFHETKKELKI